MKRFLIEALLLFAVCGAATAQFDGAVGTQGCKAIQYNDSRIVDWATNCTVYRGYYDIANNRTLASFGSDTAGIGPATASNTMEAVSLGDSGVAVLTFDTPIADGEGPDFAVYENGFGDGFLELAFVEVSSDGQRFVRFPTTSNTPTTSQVGSFANNMDPTLMNNLAGKYRIGWGTPFDLNELRDSAGLDINNITHVRLVDCIGTIDPLHCTYDAHGNIVNDPYPTAFNSGGFDLTGVAVLNQRSADISVADLDNVKVFPNPCRDFVQLSGMPIGEEYRIYDLCGKTVVTGICTSNSFCISTQDLQKGVYVLKIGRVAKKLVKK
ncbi:MAG: T9SS type A sorting domain-containing protein [Bacteroidales bacterium]|nr:T9SS type A sorting domain-containing protein [Bacteroidales bacterium]